MERPSSFVGICSDFVVDEYEGLLARAHYIQNQTNRFVMVGVKNVTPCAIPADCSSFRPFMHCTLMSKAKEPFEQLVYRTLDTTSYFVKGLQLNVLPWMNEDFAPLWRSVKSAHPHVKLVLQAHRVLMDKYTPAQIAYKLKGLAVDYVLFDPSQSLGIPYDIEVVREYVDAIYQKNLPIGVAVAGGLGGETLEDLFLPLVTEYPDLSCDAFGKLQDRTGKKLSWSAVDEYLAVWMKCVKKGV